MKNPIEYYKTASLYKKASDLLFAVAILLSLYTLISTQYLRNQLPPGVCPIDNRSELYMTSIVLLIISFIVSLFDRKKKKQDTE